MAVCGVLREACLGATEPSLFATADVTTRFEARVANTVINTGGTVTDDVVVATVNVVQVVVARIEHAEGG